MNNKSNWSVLNHRNDIYGFCALWIMVFHIEKHVGMPWNLPFITPFIQMGNAGVDIFMLLSGFCLCLSYMKNPDLRNFYKKRVVRVVLPYLIIAVPFYLWKCIWQQPLPNGAINIIGFISDITGYAFWRSGTQTSWFVAAIIFFYLFFPFIFRFVKIGKWLSLIALLQMYPLIILTQNYGFSIAVSRFPVFYIGVVMAFYGLAPKENKVTTIVAIAYILIFIGLFPIKYVIKDIGVSYTYLWLFYITMVIPIVYLLHYCFEKLQLGGAIFCRSLETIHLKYI